MWQFILQVALQDVLYTRVKPETGKVWSGEEAKKSIENSRPEIYNNPAGWMANK